MSERVFCIDFGSAFTKVALRTATREDSALVPCSDEGLELWAPTVVAADWTKGEAKLEFGYRAAGITPGGKISVFTNFKKDLFAPPVADAPGPHPLDALLQSDEFEALAAKYSVLPRWVAGLRTMAGAAKTMFGAESRGLSPEARRQDDAKRLAYHYFKWLRERVLDACARLPHTALKYEDIPLRVAVPVLGAGPDLDAHPGCQRLRDALDRSGWRLDARPFVSEPESNAVGILTGATNAVTKKNKLNFREMFNKGPLITVMAGDAYHPTYRALVIDVGAYTTDFAALSIDTGGKLAASSSGAGFIVAQRSVEFGVTNLDASVRAALDDDKRAAIDALARKDFAVFQNNAYTEGKGYRLGGGRVLGGEADQGAIQTALADFTKRLTDETAAFCQPLGAASMQELILTGGGSNIPAVRDALIGAAAKIAGSPFVKTHAPGLKRAKAGPPIDNLDERFARGASALGGASIYFEKSYY